MTTSDVTAGPRRPSAREDGLLTREWFADPVNSVNESQVHMCHAADLASTPEGAAGDPDDAVGVKLASLRRAAPLLVDVVSCRWSARIEREIQNAVVSS